MFFLSSRSLQLGTKNKSVLFLLGASGVLCFVLLGAEGAQKTDSSPQELVPDGNMVMSSSHHDPARGLPPTLVLDRPHTNLHPASRPIYIRSAPALMFVFVPPCLLAGTPGPGNTTSTILRPCCTAAAQQVSCYGAANAMPYATPYATPRSAQGATATWSGRGLSERGLSERGLSERGLSAAGVPTLADSPPTNPAGPRTAVPQEQVNATTQRQYQNNT